MTLVAELDSGPDETIAGFGPGAETEFVPDLAPTGIDMLHAWSLDDGTDFEPPSWRRASAIAAAVVMVSAAAAASTLLLWRQHRDVAQRENHASSLPPIVTTTVVPAPPPVPVSRLDGTYRIYNDWDHLTYRNNKTGTGAWTHVGEAQTVVWAFATTCSTQNDCVATGVELDDTDHQKVGTADALKLVNGIWQDMTPAHIQVNCTLNGTKVWSTLAWSLEPLPDGTFHGEFTESTDADNDCGGRGDTLVVPITATRVGPAPAGVLTGASPPEPTETIPPTSAAMAPRVSAARPAPVDPDQQYLADLNAGDVRVIDVSEVIRGAHEICAALEAGTSKGSIEGAIVASNKTLNEGHAATMVNSAVGVYCPQYGG